MWAARQPPTAQITHSRAASRDDDGDRAAAQNGRDGAGTVYAASDQGVCGGDSVTAQRSLSGLSILKQQRQGDVRRARGEDSVQIMPSPHGQNHTNICGRYSEDTDIRAGNSGGSRVSVASSSLRTAEATGWFLGSGQPPGVWRAGLTAGLTEWREGWQGRSVRVQAATVTATSQASRPPEGR